LLPSFRFYAGIYGGFAMAETIFGTNNPGGKLPVTVYYSNYTALVDMDNMSMTNGPGRSYKYYDGPVVYPFGHGLSYTTFTLNWSPTPPAEQTVTVFDSGASSVTYTVNCTNTGTLAGDETVLAYFKPRAESLRTLRDTGVPVVKKQLFAFQRVNLEPGASIALSFTVNASTLQLVDIDGHTSIHPGRFEVLFSRGHGTDLEAPIDIQLKKPIRTKEFRKWW
jgi:beta-glucosidase